MPNIIVTRALIKYYRTIIDAFYSTIIALLG